MVASQQFTRIDTLELKARICQKIGHQGVQRYFAFLRKYLDGMISKNEFHKSCIRIFGKDNLRLLQQLLKAALKNAAHGTVAPVPVKRATSSQNVKLSNGCQKNSRRSIHGLIPPSPRKNRSPRGRKSRAVDRPSPLGPNAKTPTDPKVEEHQSPTELLSLGSRPPVEVVSVEDGEEVASMSPGIQSRSPVTAPLGISLKGCGNRKTFLRGASHYIQQKTCQSIGELPDTRSLRSHLEQKVANEGLNVSVDCTNVLNNALDVYLKRLIEPCRELARSRSGQTNPEQSRWSYGNNPYLPIISTPVSVLDFRAAVELDPCKLGGDWPTQLEKISAHSYAD